MVWWASDDIQTDLCQKKSKKHKDEQKGDWGAPPPTSPLLKMPICVQQSVI